MSRRRSCILILLTVALLAAWLPACKLGPNYSRPEIISPENHRGVEGPALPESLADVPWWEVFQDPATQG